jgi:hypothetical protein
MPALNGNANHATSTYRNFDLVRKFKLDFTDVEVSKWRSRVTGLSVVHLDYDGTWLLTASNCKHLLTVIMQHPWSMATLLSLLKVSHAFYMCAASC